MKTLALVLLASTALLTAQVNTGTISGAVTDQSGSAIPGAKISLRNQNTGVESSLTGNDTGLYKSPFLTPGVYSVRVEAKGFRVAEIKNIEVQLGKEVTVNATLEVGAVTESVVVEGAAPVIEESTAQVTTVFESKKVMNIPRATRGIDVLALLAPGVQPGIGFTNTNGISLSVNGQRTRANNFMLEGQDNNDPSIGGPGLFVGNPEVVSEFSIVTNQFSAEYGRNAGAIVNIGLKSGDNQFHGVGSWFHRNDEALGALTNFQRRSGLKEAPKRIENKFGGSVTGPVIKNKWFFMGYGFNEKRRVNARSEASAATLTPTPAGLQTLSQAFPNSPTVRALRELGPFGVQLGTTTFAPAGTVPVTTPAGATVNVEMGRIIRTFAQPFDGLEYGTRQDFVLNERHRFNGRYLFQEQVTQAATGSGLNGYLVDTPGRTHNFGGTHTWSLNSTTVNEARFSWQKNGFFFEGGPSFPFAEIGKNIANFTFLNGNLGFGLATNLPQFREVKRWQIQDNFSKQIGRHFLKTGFQLSRDNIFLGFLPQVNGAYFFDNLQTFAENRPTSFNGAAGDPLQNPKQVDQYYYFQDDWKIRRNLTLNLGIRYEYSGQPLNILNDLTVRRESNAQTAIFNPNLPLADRTVRRLSADRNNFQPRVGFAWSPESKNRFFKDTVIRGGYGIMNEPAFYNMLLNIQSSAPVALLYTLTGNAVPVTNDFTGANLLRLASPPRGTDPRTLNQTQFAGDFRLPLIHSFSIGIQKRIGNNQGFEIRYAATRGRDQFMTINGNPFVAGFTANGWASVVPQGITAGTNTACAACNGRQFPTNAAIRTRNNGAFNDYNGLQTRYDARLFKQLTLGSSYTWSRNIDNVSEIFESAGNGSVAIAQNPWDLVRGERGVSNIDLKHAWTMNFVWDIPAGPLGNNSIAKWFAQGWSLSGVTSWYGGRPMQPLQLNSGAASVNDRGFMQAFVGRSDHVRPFNGNPNAPVNSIGRVLANGQLVNYFNNANPVSLNDVRWVYNDLNSARFFNTPFGIGRNVLRGPRAFEQSMSVFKNISFTERFKMQLRFEATNFFNNTNLLIPPLNPENGAAAFMNPQETESTPRILNIGMRFFF